MKTRKNPMKQGGVLLMAMLMVLAFSILAIGLFKLFDTDALETVSIEHHRRAFWMAETGLEEVMDRLVLDEFFRSSPGSYIPYTVDYTGGSFSNGSYTIESITTTSAGGTGAVYSVVSRGNVGSMNRRIQMDVLVRPGGPHALRSMRGDVEIDSNVYIDGDVFVDVGDVTINAKENLNPNNPTGIDGYLVAGGSVSGRGAASVDTIQVSPPPQPSIDTDFWNTFLTAAWIDPNANTNNSIGDIYITGISNFNCSASTLPVLQTRPDIVIDGDVSGTEGFHYLVSTTDLNIDNRAELMSRSIIVVRGDVNIDQRLKFNEACVIYATGNIRVRQSFDATGVGGTLIAGGDLILEQSMDFTGIFFADGKVEVGQNATVTGTIIGGDGISLGSNVEVTFDPDAFLNPLPGINNVWNQANLASRTWTEIAPAN